jgi:ribosomal protein S18 acetylase RimI-like enzyme
VLGDVERNHRSWLARGRETIGLDGVTLFLGEANATLAFPQPDADLETAVSTATEHGVSEIGCWAIEPDEALGRRLIALGFQDGWQPHWMGVEPARRIEPPGLVVEESGECSAAVPYGHAPAAPSDVARHFVARDRGALVGHVVLHVEGDSGGIYDMGVAPGARRRGHGTALTLAAVNAAHGLGCSSVTLNATAEGELLYRRAGFASLGHGMTWWSFPRRPAC